MVCPKCGEGILKKILFTKNKETGFLCDVCGFVWLHNERVGEATGHVLEELTKDGDIAYTFIDFDKDDEKNKSVLIPKYK